MNDQLPAVAERVASQLAKLETRRKGLAEEGFAALERADPETAKLVLQVFVSRAKAIDWMTHSVRSLGEQTPWQCIADGGIDRVRNVLNSIAHGVYA